MYFKFLININNIICIQLKGKILNLEKKKNFNLVSIPAAYVESFLGGGVVTIYTYIIYIIYYKKCLFQM